MAASVIDTATIQAYMETDYRVCGDAAFTIRIGEASEALAAAQRLHHASCSAFITAFNPFSRPLDRDANLIRHTALHQEIERQNLLSIVGVGQHPSNQWPGEESLLIFGLPLELARTLGRRFEQNAIVWCDFDATPRLVLLR